MYHVLHHAVHHPEHVHESSSLQHTPTSLFFSFSHHNYSLNLHPNLEHHHVHLSLPKTCMLATNILGHAKTKALLLLFLMLQKFNRIILLLKFMAFYSLFFQTGLSSSWPDMTTDILGGKKRIMLSYHSHHTERGQSTSLRLQRQTDRLLNR